VPRIYQVTPDIPDRRRVGAGGKLTPLRRLKMHPL
jgi:hypothetical protein